MIIKIIYNCYSIIYIIIIYVKKSIMFYKYKINKGKSNHIIEEPKFGINRNKRVKRSSLICPDVKIQFKNKNKHVTFTQKKIPEIEENYGFDEKGDIIHKKKVKINENKDNNSKNSNNIKRIKLFEDND